MAEQTPSVQSDYNESNIQVLEGIQHVRHRPAMYISGTSLRGLHHLVYEIVDNSIDEAMAGYCKNILVKINADGSVSVSDDGRGIPVGMHPTEKIPTLELVFVKVGAGGKFDHTDGAAYSTSGGLHGVGASVVNALSEWLEVEVSRDGKIYHMEFERGVKSSDIRVIGTRAKNGTKVTFKPDADIFPDTTFHYDTLAGRLRELAFLNEGLYILIEDERTGKREEFKYTQGLVQYVHALNYGKIPLHSDVIHFEKDDPATRLIVEVALQYNDGFNETILTFANNIHNHDGGSHLSGFKTALTGTVNRYAESLGMMKDVRPSGDDVREGLVAVVSVKLPEPQFESQTKDKLLNPDVESFVLSAVNERLGNYFEENPKTAKLIFEKGMMAAEAREAARKARELTRRKNSLEGSSLPGKLSDCRSKSNEDTELFLVEGLSAGGTAKSGRDSNVQAILALKGKILNVEKANLVKMLGHEEIRTIISALGCGIREEFDIEKRRYGKIIIMTDADVDGSHIRTLLLTFFFRHMGDLIKAGRVYVAQPPLYLVTRKRKDEFVLNERAMRDIYTSVALEGAHLLIRDPETGQTLRKIEGEEIKRVIELLGRLEELIKIVQRRGIDFAELLHLRDAQQRLPIYRVIVEGQDHFFHTAQERDQFLEAQPLLDADAEAPAPSGNGNLKRLQMNHEMHELKDFDKKIVAPLEQFGLSIDDYFLTQEESVSGEKMRTKYALVNAERTVDVAGVGQIILALHDIARKQIEVKRFKGLGEMNSEQLWETTLNPARRMLLRVTMEDASEAERMFTVLMGEDVEARRQYIEAHALEVKNLDV